MIRVDPEEPSLKEWETARAVIAAFDERLHDLRKYGFTFVTALLAAEGLFLRQGEKLWDDLAKATVLLVTLLLFGALRLLEKKYQLIQRAAVRRSIVLERRLGLELSEFISDRYAQDQLRRYDRSVQWLFTSAVAVLMLGVLSSGRAKAVGFIVALVLGLVEDLGIRGLKSRLPRGGMLDWTIWPLTARFGEAVTITVTNLAGDPHCFEAGSVLWSASLTGGVVHREISPAKLEVHGFNNHTWLWGARPRPRLRGAHLDITPDARIIMPRMRTTLTLERDVAERLPREMRREVAPGFGWGGDR